MNVEQISAALRQLEDEKVLAVNERHGDDHAVKLGELRTLAKRIGPNESLAQQLWSMGCSAERLLAILILRPKSLGPDQLDAMLREARTPKVQDWLVNYIVKKNPHAESLRLRWLTDPDPVVQSAGWALTSEHVRKNSAALDLPELLNVIEEQMEDAPERLQWAMNDCLGNIGIHHAEHRARVLNIGERLGVLKDYPTPPNCTSPYVPIWVAEMVRRRQSV